MTQKYDECPRCNSGLTEHWQMGGKLCQVCCWCDWKGEPFTPEQRPIVSTRRVRVSTCGGFSYDIFDRYGHPLVASRAYASRESALDAIKLDLQCGEHDTRGPYTAVLWPADVEVTGEVFTS
jgi:hypothetical protein